MRSAGQEPCLLKLLRRPTDLARPACTQSRRLAGSTACAGSAAQELWGWLFVRKRQPESQASNESSVSCVFLAIMRPWGTSSRDCRSERATAGLAAAHAGMKRVWYVEVAQTVLREANMAGGLARARRR
jgi:hypothetical protein